MFLNLITQLIINELPMAAGREWGKDEGGWRIARLSKGAGYWLDNKQLQDVATGDMMVIGPQCQGTFRASQLSDCLLHFFYFRPENLVGLLSASERITLESLGGIDKCRIIAAKEQAALEYGHVLSQEHGRRTFFNRCRLLNVAALAFSHVWSAVPDPGAFPTAATRIEELVANLSDADLLKCDSEELATMCGCGVRNFRRTFHKLFNTSVRAKRRELRLEKARQLLAETNMTIAAIADECGFGDHGLFYNLFKKRFGVPPKVWREINIQSGTPKPKK